MNKINFTPQVPPIPPSSASSPTKKSDGVNSFESLLKNYVNDVNDLQLNADKAIEKLNTGEIQDVHQAVIAAEEAEVAFRMMMEVRNKLVEAYKEIKRMQV